MLVNFFIDRPIFASVLAIVIVVAGAVAIPSLPIAMFPEITPPQVVVTATYPGASAEVVEQTVATPIEQQVNGVEDMIYMSSRSGSDGTMTLTVTFKVGTDLDIAAVNVQNRVSIAQAKLPADVTRQGLTIVKQSPDLVEIVALTSPDGSRDELFLANYATLQVVDVLARVPGVGQVTVFNGRDYGMRLWLNPDRLASLGLTAGDVADAVREQNLQAAAGQIGQPPSLPGQSFQYTVTTRGRLSTPAEFDDIILRTRSDGSLLRVRDVARVELGAQSYGSFGRVGGKPAALIGIFQLPGANALDVSKGVQAAVARLAPSFPSGVTHERPYNTTEFVRVSIEEVVLTLFIAIALVVLVVYVFLQDWRATLIPTMTIPVSLVGTFAVISVFGFSINTLTLFGLVLAIGIVVDDAIVVVENTQRHLDEDGGLDAREAARRATAEVVGPVIATALVLMAVFIPIAFLPGITGQLYRQFALTIAVSVALSALNALTLTPALCALLLRPAGATRKRWLARTWDAAFLRLTNGYDRTVRRILRRSALAVVVLLLLTAAAYGLLRVVPTGFAPTEDQGYLLVNVQLPDAASVERTDAVVREIEKILLETPGVETVVAIGGRSFITGVNGPNVASLFPRLTPWSKRKSAELQAGAILGRLRARLSSIQEASIVVFPPPPIRGISSGGGFQFELQSVAGGSLQELDETARKVMDAARQRPELAATFTGFRAGVPQLDAQVDRAKAKALGIPLSDVFSSLQIFLGSLYVNDFNAFGRVYRVQLQAEPSFRASPSDVARLYVRSQPSASGPAQMVPLSTLVTVKPITGPDTISHYNLYRTAEIAGDTAPGASSGQAIAAMQEVARSVMPAGMSYEWTGLAYQELEAGSRAGFVFALSALFVFLVLAAQYESWLVPLAVLLAVPLGVLGALGALWLAGLANDVYAQIGLALLMGLASKNAILIVEFAKERREHGAEIQEAAREAARLRFRPILMTSFAFILGSLPLVFATGAGAASRNSMGTTVVGGMLAVTVIGVLLVPAFYVAVERFAESGRRPTKKGAEDVDVAPRRSTV